MRKNNGHKQSKLDSNLTTYCCTFWGRQGVFPTARDLNDYVQKKYDVLKYGLDDETYLQAKLRRIANNFYQLHKRRSSKVPEIAKRIWGYIDGYDSDEKEEFRKIREAMVLRWVMSGYVDLKKKTSLDAFIATQREVGWLEWIIRAREIPMDPKQVPKRLEDHPIAQISVDSCSEISND